MPPLLGWLPGTISGTEETRNSRLVPQLPRTRIRRPKCDKCSRPDSPQRPSPQHCGEIRELAWVPGTPGLSLDNRRCWACLRRSLTRNQNNLPAKTQGRHTNKTQAEINTKALSASQ